MKMNIQITATFTNRSLEALLSATGIKENTYWSRSKKKTVWNFGGREYTNRGSYGRAILALVNEGIIAVNTDIIKNATCSSGYPLFKV
jgi:hypothetical protein